MLRAAGETETTQRNIQDWLQLDEGATTRFQLLTEARISPDYTVLNCACVRVWRLEGNQLHGANVEYELFNGQKQETTPSNTAASHPKAWRDCVCVTCQQEGGPSAYHPPAMYNTCLQH
jgi:hypothetical protein